MLAFEASIPYSEAVNMIHGDDMMRVREWLHAAWVWHNYWTEMSARLGLQNKVRNEL